MRRISCLLHVLSQYYKQYNMNNQCVMLTVRALAIMVLAVAFWQY